MLKVLIMGSTGMLGSACSKVLSSNPEIEVVKTNQYGSAGSIGFKAGIDRIELLLEKVNPDYIINCIGVIKPHIEETVKSKVLNAIKINSVFPYLLQVSAEKFGANVIQIATDCVYSGFKGYYSENDSKDALDVYGKTKSLGEVLAGNFLNLRCSIIGPEIGRSTSLLEWFKSQPENANLNGFIDHEWNGVTTHAFASVIEGILTKRMFFSGTQHLVPGDSVSKYELLELFKKYYGRSDIQISKTTSKETINRTLTTLNTKNNSQLWENSKYSSAPSIEQMVEDQPKQI